jgi:hypothetical protein
MSSDGRLVAGHIAPTPARPAAPGPAALEAWHWPDVGALLVAWHFVLKVGGPAARDDKVALDSVRHVENTVGQRAGYYVEK